MIIRSSFPNFCVLVGDEHAGFREYKHGYLLAEADVFLPSLFAFEDKVQFMFWASSCGSSKSLREAFSPASVIYPSALSPFNPGLSAVQT